MYIYISTHASIHMHTHTHTHTHAHNTHTHTHMSHTHTHTQCISAGTDLATQDVDLFTELLDGEQAVKDVEAVIARDALIRGSKQSAAGGDSVSRAMPPHGPMHIRHTPTPLAPLFYIYHRLVGVPRHSLADNLHG